VKNVSKGQDAINDNTDQIHAFVDEFLEEEMKSSIMHETDEELNYKYWT
jgi:hypothetical protein